MLIVLEGCDGSGKTTLANKLAQMVDADIIHCTTETPNDMEFFRSILKMSISKNIIADRFCYGQFVYQKPEERKLSVEQLYTLELDMLMAGAKVIFVECFEDIMEKRLAERSEKTDLPIHEIQKRYEQVFSKSIMPITVVDTSEPQLIVHPFYTKE